MIDPRSLAIAKLAQEQREGATPKPKRPRMLALDALSEEPEVFQMRERGGSLERFDETVQSLLSLLRQKRKLEPVWVWWTGKRWVILDGHHRLAAYRLHSDATGATEKTYKVPVKVSSAVTIEEAEKAAHRDNSMVRNPVHDVDRKELGWKLTTEDPTRSYGYISERTGLSPSTARNMRKTYQLLRDKRWSVQRIKNASWGAARAGLAEPKPDISAMDAADYYALMEREADRFQETLKKHLKGNKWTKLPDAWALMFRDRYPDFFRRVLESEYLEEFIGSQEDDSDHHEVDGD